MQNRRFKEEIELSTRLEGHDSGYNAQDLSDFEDLLDQRKNAYPWYKIISIGALLSLGFVLFFWTTFGGELSEKNATNGDFINTHKTDSKTIQIEEGKNEVLIDESIGDGTVKKTNSILNVESTSTKNSVLNNNQKIGFGKSNSNQTIARTESNYLALQSTIDSNIGVSKSIRIDDRDDHLRESLETHFVENGLKKLADNFIENERKEISKSADFQQIETPTIAIDLLPNPFLYLETDKITLEGLEVESQIISIEKKPKKRVSFGIQYNSGYTHAGKHETPFVSNFETFIDGGPSIGYGLFGLVNANRRISLNPYFAYNKNTHLHFVNNLIFQTGPTNINFELHSHELKFGMDFAFNFLSDFKYVDLKAGAGLAYHKIISLESNNYYTQDIGTIKDLNELDLSPMSYKLFLAVEIPIYNDFVVGVEPYIIYQKRRARYTPSLFLADQGDYNLISGLNLTLRF